MKTFARLIVIAAVASIILVWVAACFGQSLDTGGWRASTVQTATELWQWSAPAEHHKAAVKVRSSTGSAGSGVYVAHGECIGVLTAAHILDGTSYTCTFSDGSSQTGEGTIDKYSHDIGWVFVANPNLTPLEVAAVPPQVGERVEFVTWGGPESRLRHFWCQVESDGIYQAYVVSGDSGGAILNDRHEVVGIQSYGRSGSVSERWGVYRGSGAAPLTALRDFCDRVVAAGCCPRRCPPQGRGMDWRLGIGGGIQFYPPHRPAQPIVPVRPIAPEPVPPQPQRPAPEVVPEHPDPAVDYDKLALALIAAGIVEQVAGKMPSPQQGERGPAGPPGPPGPLGPSGQIDYSKIPPLPVRQLFMNRDSDGDWFVENEQVDQVFFSQGEGLTIRVFPPQAEGK